MNEKEKLFIQHQIQSAIFTERENVSETTTELSKRIDDLQEQIEKLQNTKIPEELNTITQSPKFEIGELVIFTEEVLKKIFDDWKRERSSGYMVSYDYIKSYNNERTLEVKDITEKNGKYLYECRSKHKIVERFEEALQLSPNNKYGDFLDKIVESLINYYEKNSDKNDTVIKKYKDTHQARESSGIFEGIDLRQVDIRLDEAQQPETELMKRTREALHVIFKNIDPSDLHPSLSKLKSQNYFNDEKYNNGLYLYHPDIGKLDDEKQKIIFSDAMLLTIIDQLNSVYLGGKKRRKTKKARKTKKSRKQ